MKLTSFLKSIITLTIFLSLTPTTNAQRTDIRRYKSAKYQVCRIAIDKANSQPVVEYFHEQLTKQPDDPESFFGLAMAYGQLNDIDSAMKYLKKAVGTGLPFERFLAGPRNLFQPLYDSDEFKKYAAQHPIELLHGPMLGDITKNSAKFWVRTTSEVPFKVKVSTSKEMKDAIISNTVKTSKDADFTGVVEAKGLKPDTRYYYQLFLNDKVASVEPAPSFQTYPESKAKTRFQIAFGGGSNNIPQNEWIWDTILSRKPLAFLFLGDNTYFNIPDVREHQEYFFYRRHSRPEFRRMVASTSIYAIWDDHDFGGNDSIGGPRIDQPAWKKQIVLPVFKENFNNPYYGGGEKNPGCWHHFSIGDVDFFMLDGRYYRTDPQRKIPLYTDPNAAHPSMLGPVQKQWLLDKLKASKATFKVIASPVPWAFDTKTGMQTSPRGRIPGAEDTWQGFAEEREEIFSFIEKNRIEGIFLISADRHRSDAWKIERPNGYDFYEANTSHLTKNASHAMMPNAIFSILGKPAFGLLTFDTTKPDPEITYEVVKIDNKVAASLTVKKSQLTFNKPSKQPAADQKQTGTIKK